MSKKADPNLAAMEALKEKLKNFVLNHMTAMNELKRKLEESNHNQIAKLEKEIISLRKQLGTN